MSAQQLTMRQAARIVHSNGFTGLHAVAAVAIIWGESGGDAHAVNVVDHNPASRAYLSCDIGLWQINSYWHPEVSATCALSASCNARAAARISRQGRRWREWWTWKNNKHVPFMSRARAAQAAVCGG